MDVYNRLGGKKIMESYSNYNLDDILVRTFMMPAVMPKDKINMINMPNNTYSSNQNNNMNHTII